MSEDMSATETLAMGDITRGLDRLDVLMYTLKQIEKNTRHTAESLDRLIELWMKAAG